MTNSILTTNLIYGAVFVLSGIVIDLSFQRAKMTVARKLFKILFFVVLVYLPFYFGGSLLTGVLSNHIQNDVVKVFFEYFMTRVLTMPFLFFKSISLISVAVAAIVACGSVIAFVSIVSKLLVVMRRFLLEERIGASLTTGPVTFIDRFHGAPVPIYKLTCKFLN